MDSEVHAFLETNLESLLCNPRGLWLVHRKDTLATYSSLLFLIYISYPPKQAMASQRDTEYMSWLEAWNVQLQELQGLRQSKVEFPAGLLSKHLSVSHTVIPSIC